GLATHRAAQVVFHDVLGRLRAALPVPEEDLVRALDAMGAAVRTVQEELADPEPGRRRGRPPLPG
ncbi:MAG TPA: hypothetical protein VE547_22950, partial [Mycobacteriales bacterium]|nr:hypothetical protein [Mycobacteriales bacterium]